MPDVRFGFDDFVIDTARYVLERGGEAQHVQPQVFDVLGYLIIHRDRVVPKEELLDEIWGDRFVSESTLTSRIKVARQIVGDNGINQTTIKTTYGRGYRWVGGVDELPEPAEPDGSEPLPPDPHHEQRIHFCRTPDGVRVAYATVGHGPPLVRSAHWITHLEYDWRSPVWRHWLDGLSRHRTLVRYDERGCGLSDHDPEELTFETFVQDLEVVVDDLGLDVFPLLGVSQGGPVAVEYARRHPGRVSHLILVGAFVKGRLARADDPDLVASNDLQRDLIRIGWGRDDPSHRLFFSSTFMPDASPELWTDFAQLLRRTTSAENALRIFDASAWTDVTTAAAEVTVPTMIVHARGDMRVPYEHALEYATLIPRSRLVTLDSRNHLLRPDEPAWGRLLDEIDRFLGDGRTVSTT